MMRTPKWIAVVAMTVVLAQACGGVGDPAPASTTATSGSVDPPISISVAPSSTPATSEPMTLMFGSTECVYEGPSIVSAGRANLTFVNNSGATGAVNVIELLDDKTWEDIVDYAGEQPSSKHAPPWTRDVRQWRPIPSGETLLWEEELTPGTYAIVCANTSPLAVWLGSRFEVEG